MVFGKMSYKNPAFILTCLFLIAVVLMGCPARTTSSTTSSGSIQFRVADTDDQPLQGAKVVSEAQPEGQMKLSGLTDADGTVIFKDIKAGDYRFYINRFDYYQTEIALTVLAGQTNPFEVQLTRANPTSTSPTGPAVETTFAQLVAEPGKYNGQVITIEGFWFDGFEIAVLAERLEPSSFAPGNVQPAGTLIWVKNGLPEEVSERLYLQPNNATGYPAHYGKVKLTGILEFGDRYGHMNAYNYQLTTIDGEWMDWTPTAN